jgi:hypothetical protein
MTTTKVPAYVTFGARDVPWDEALFHGQSVALIYRADAPCLARLVGATFGFSVTLHGLAEGTVNEHVEPYGQVTISPSENGCGFQWVVVDVDHPDGSNAQVWLAAEQVGEFLADVALAQIFPPAADRESDWVRAKAWPQDGAA